MDTHDHIHLPPEVIGLIGEFGGIDVRRRLGIQPHRLHRLPLTLNIPPIFHNPIHRLSIVYLPPSCKYMIVYWWKQHSRQIMYCGRSGDNWYEYTPAQSIE